MVHGYRVSSMPDAESGLAGTPFAHAMGMMMMMPLTRATGKTISFSANIKLRPTPV